MNTRPFNKNKVNKRLIKERKFYLGELKRIIAHYGFTKDELFDDLDKAIEEEYKKEKYLGTMQKWE